MSIDPNVSLTAAPNASAPAIENELPAYRAISPLAVVSLILGVLSILSFATSVFLGVAAAAVLLGALAVRRIRRFPDALTGRGFAQAGIGLGLVFGLASVSVAATSYLVRAREAKAFALHYEDVLRRGSTDDLAWYASAPNVRQGQTAKQLMDGIRKDDNQARTYEQHRVPLILLKNVLAKPGSEVHFEAVENHADDGDLAVAAARFGVHNAAATKPEDKEQFALALMKAKRVSGKYAWWVESVTYPYEPGTHAMAEKPVDDGHGH